MRTEFALNRVVLAATLVATFAGPAAAAPLATLPATGALATDQTVTLSFASGSGAGQLGFELDGYATLDGDNFWIDILEVRLDGQLLVSGTWNLGGGGVDRVLSNAAGATITRTGDQSLSFDVPLTLLAGGHTLAFSVTSPTEFEGLTRSGFQGLGDEGWGLTATAVAGPVPEPAPAALLAAGLAALALAARRR